MNRNTRHFEVLGESYFLVFLCLSKDFIHNAISDHALPEYKKNQVFDFFSSNLEEPAKYQKDYLEFIPVPPGRYGPEQVDGCIEQLANELALKSPGYTQMVLGLVSRILSFLQEPAWYTCTHNTLDSSAEAYLFNKVTRIMEDQDGRVTRNELTEQLSYTGDYINRVVKKHSGMSLSEYNQVICLKKAEQMLTGTSLSVNSIISNLGFENKTHFYKLFDRKHGITPLAYRKRHNAEGALFHHCL